MGGSRPGCRACWAVARSPEVSSVEKRRLDSTQTPPESATLPPTLLPSRFAHGGETLSDAPQLGNWTGKRTVLEDLNVLAAFGVILGDVLSGKKKIFTAHF